MAITWSGMMFKIVNGHKSVKNEARDIIKMLSEAHSLAVLTHCHFEAEWKSL
jgi:hypothetical protein